MRETSETAQESYFLIKSMKNFSKSHLHDNELIYKAWNHCK